MDAGMIEDYLEAFRARLRWRPDVDDLVAEVADHLREHVDRLVLQGVPPQEAEGRALSCFGGLDQVALSFTVSDSGGLAIPSRRTRLAGLAGLVAGATWVASTAAAVTGGHMDLFVPWNLQRYYLWVVLLMAALGLTTVALAGVLLRIGRLSTLRGRAVLAAGAALVLAMTVFGWAVTVISGVLGLTVLAAFQGDEPALTRFVGPSRLLAVWLVGGVSLVVLDEVLGVGPIDEYGDHQLAWLLPFLICALFSATAMALVGSRLWSERPTPFDIRPDDVIPRAVT